MAIKSIKLLQSNMSKTKITDKQLISVFGNHFNNSDLEEINKVLKSHLVGNGKNVTEFENEFSKKNGFKYAVATNSCTNSFWLLLRNLKLPKDSEILIPNIHFYGIKNVLEILNINYVVTDVSTEAPNIHLENIVSKINDKTKAIIFLEYGGYPVQIAEIKNYLKKIKREDILLILDAANSPFTKVNGDYSAKEYDFVIYSFDMNKIIVTGDGGMILTNNRKMYNLIREQSFYGLKDASKSSFDKSKDSKGKWWELEIGDPSIKLTMNNISAALGLNQLRRIDKVLMKRAKVKNTYLKEFTVLVKEGKFSLPKENESYGNNVYLFWLRLNDEKKRNKLASFLLNSGIYSTVKYQPLDANANTPNALAFYKTSLCIPINQNITKDEQKYIITKIKQFFKNEK